MQLLKPILHLYFKLKTPKNMKTNFLTSFLFLLSIIVFAKPNDDTKPYLTKTFNAAGINALNVNTSGGSITVTGQGGDARVEVYISGNNWGSNLDKDEIETRLKDYTLNIKQEGNTLVCEAKRNSNNNWKNGLNISFKVFVPEKITSELKTSGGSIKISNLNGDAKGQTSGGSIDLKNCNAAKILMNTSGGSISASDCQGDIRLTTSGGSIHLDEMKGNVVANTSGGSIEVEECTGDVSATTSGGSIRLKKLSGAVKARTSGGGIHAELLISGKSVELATSGGGIHAQIPLDKGANLDLRADRVKVGALNNFDGKVEKDHVQGKINGGGALISMRTSGGSISLNK